MVSDVTRTGLLLGFVSTMLIGVDSTFLACWAYFGPVSDLGWTYAHNLARANADEKLDINSKYVEGVALMDDAGQRKVLDGFIADGCDMIVTGSGALTFITMEYAQKHNTTKWYNLGGFGPDSLVAMGGGHGKLYQAQYICGIIAAMQPGVKKVGYIGSTYMADSLLGINAFFLGVRSVNPTMELVVLHTGSWYAPREEKIAAKRLFHYHGVDAINYDSDSTVTIEAAKAEGKFSFGIKADGTALYGEHNLASQMYVWNTMIEEATARAKDTNASRWVNERNVNKFVGMDKFAVSLGTLSSKVDEKVRGLVREQARKFAAGNDTVFCQQGGFKTFCPVGATKPSMSFGGTPPHFIFPCVQPKPTDTCISDADKMAMTWMLEGVTDLGLLEVPRSCPPGTYMDPLATELCVRCPKGKFSTKVDADKCEDCAFGTYVDELNATVCKPCLAGKFANTTGSSECPLCAPGHFSGGVARECTPCLAGTYRELPGAVGIFECEKCPVGRFNGKQGTAVCERCPRNLTTGYPGTTEESGCVCQPGSFQSTKNGVSSCTSCAVEMPGSIVIDKSAKSIQDCVCPAGTYDGEVLHSRKECMKCGEGHVCNEVGLVRPKIAKGYYVKDQDPSAMYLCEPTTSCLGGEFTANICQRPRSGFLCMDCPDGMAVVEGAEGQDGGCQECSVLTSVLVGFAPVIVFVLCVAVIWHSRIQPLDEKPLMLELQNTFGQLIMFVQVVNAITATRMDYGEPMTGFLSMALEHVDPESLFTSAHCLSQILSDALPQYALGIVCPLALIICLFGTHLISKFFFNGILPLTGFFNIVGEVLIEFYVSITLAIFSPFNCYSHPNGTKSVQSYPQIICGEGQHKGMTALAILGAFLYPLNAMACAIFLTWQFPRTMMKANPIKFLMSCRFLFERWNPKYYWFCNVTIARNFVIAVLPSVMPQEELDVTILCMTMTLMIALVLAAFFSPRRTPGQNYLDLFISMVQLAILSCGVTSVHGQPLKESLSAGCVSLIVAVGCAVLALSILRACQLVSQSVSYSMYLSHHAGAGGTSCRLLYSILSVTLQKGRVFYDIDHLDCTAVWLDAVRVSRNVTIAFGSATLCRLWCIGAMVCAYRKGTPLHSVIFVDPKAENTVCGVAGPKSTMTRTTSNKVSGKSRRAALEVDTSALRGFGLPQEDVLQAIKAFTHVEPVFMNFVSESELSRSFEELFERMTWSVAEVGANQSKPEVNMASKFYQNSRRLAAQMQDMELMSDRLPFFTLILIDHLDVEAVAASRLFHSFLVGSGKDQPSDLFIEDQDLSSSNFATAMKSGKLQRACVLLTSRSLQSPSQLARLGLLVKLNPNADMFPIAVGATFDFPDEQYLRDLETGVALQLGASASELLSGYAGHEVSLKAVTDAVSYTMGFLLTFINVPQMKTTLVEKAVIDLLSNNAGGRRRDSFNVSEKEASIALPPPAKEEDIVEVAQPKEEAEAIVVDVQEV